MRTFAVVNQKGGCGKTTTAINLAGVFASRGYRTLLVDMDPQGHCAVGLAIPEQRVDLHIGDAMLAPDDAQVDPQRLLWRVMRNLDLAPSTLKLAAFEAARGELAGRNDAEQRLRVVLERFKPRYDVCLIDCSPAIGMLTFNALVSADEVIIPVETGFFSLQGATKQINSIKSLGKRLGVAPPHHLLATLHDPSSALSQDLLEELRRRFGNRVLPVVIRFDHALRESASFGQPVIEYSPQSTGAQDYTGLADHLIAHSLRPGAQVSAIANHSFDGDGTASADVRASGPEIHVVPGVGDRMIASSRREIESSTPAEQPTTWPAPSSSLMNVQPQPMTPATAPSSPTLEASMTRAMDLVARARRLQTTPDAFTGQIAGVTMTPTTAVPTATTIPSPAAPAASRATVASTTAVHMVRNFGVQVTPEGVLFCQPISIGREVGIAGEFNGWSPRSATMRANPQTGMLEALLPVPTGGTQYRLVVDGKWMPDPFNPHTAVNPFGELNSIIEIPVSLRPASQRLAEPVGSGGGRLA